MIAADILRRQVGREEVLKRAQRLLDVDAVVGNGKGQVIDIGHGRTEAALVGRDLAGQRHGERRAAMEAAGEGDHAGPARGRAGDLDGVLDRFGARRQQQRPRLAGEGRDAFSRSASST